MQSLAAAAPAARWLLLATAIIWVALELRQSITHRPEGQKAGWGSEAIFRLVVAAGAGAAIVLMRVAPGAVIRPAAVAAWAGLALFLLGVSLRVWSFRTLGRYFTFVVQASSDQPVITDGPYRFIRHPSYAGFLLVVIALGLLIGNWWSLLSLAVAVTGGLVFRIHVEEKALLESLGDRYRSYAAARKRLVPFIW